MTSDPTSLVRHEPCTTSDSVIIGDGTCLSIANIGSFTLASLHTPLLFSNVLHVLTMSKNLILVSALYVDNPVNVLFFYSFFHVQARHTGITLVHGHGVYYYPMSVPLQSSALTLSSLVWSSFFAISMWHSGLGHRSLHIFHKFLSILNVSFPDEHLCSFSCTSCNINKSHKLSFAKFGITSSSPLDVIFSDVWTSPISSSDGFKYNVIFFDHYTKYIWLYQLHRKSDVHSTFVTFKQLIETTSPPPLKYFSHIMGVNF